MSFWDFARVLNWSRRRAFVCQHVHGWRLADEDYATARPPVTGRRCRVCYRAFWWYR